MYRQSIVLKFYVLSLLYDYDKKDDILSLIQNGKWLKSSKYIYDRIFLSDSSYR